MKAFDFAEEYEKQSSKPVSELEERYQRLWKLLLNPKHKMTRNEFGQMAVAQRLAREKKHNKGKNSE